MYCCHTLNFIEMRFVGRRGNETLYNLQYHKSLSAQHFCEVTAETLTIVSDFGYCVGGWGLGLVVAAAAHSWSSVFSSVNLEQSHFDYSFERTWNFRSSALTSGIF